MLIEKIAIPWMTLYTSVAILLLIGIVLLVDKIREIIERE